MNRRITTFSAVACTILALVALGNWALNTGLWCDELLFLRAVELGPIEGLMRPGSSHPPLMKWLMWPWAGAHLPDWALRMPSLLAAVTTIWVWKRLLQRLIDDVVTEALLLPALVFNVTWLALAYQCVPYALLTLLGSLHALAWLDMLHNPSRRSLAWFVVTGVLLPWTHFYGINVLVADQVVWLLLLLRRRSTRRMWLSATLMTFALTAPLLPVVAFYSWVEQEIEIVQITDYLAYFPTASAEIFARTTFFGMRITQPVWLLWIVLAIAALAAARRWKGRWRPSDQPCVEPASDCDRWSLASVACGAFLAGLPAAQAHSLFSGEAMWERYTVAGMWIDWPMALMLLVWCGQRRAACAVALAVLVVGLMIFRLGPEASPLFTNDYRPVVRYLREQEQRGDAYFAQDLDIWREDANYERLWFQRYSGSNMPLLTGPQMRRIQAYQHGLPLHVADSSVKRIWVHSLLFQPEWYRQMPVRGWQLERVVEFPGNYPIALFERCGKPQQPDALADDDPPADG